MPNNHDCLNPPFIQNEWDKFRNIITQNDSVKLSTVEEFELRQGFFAGFAKACKILSADFPDNDKQYFLDEIKQEIAHFSKVNREFAAKIGVVHKKFT